MSTEPSLPFLIVVLILGAIFFTFWYRWINVRGLKHSINVIQGKYDNPEDTGEISHFRALTSALSATVGLGNIAGVAIAIQLGGPGAVFWIACRSGVWNDRKVQQLYLIANVSTDEPRWQHLRRSPCTTSISA